MKLSAALSQLPWDGTPECPSPRLPLYCHFLWRRESQRIDSLPFCFWSLELESSKPLAGFLSQGHPSSYETTAWFLPGVCNPSSSFLPSLSLVCVLRWMVSCPILGAARGESEWTGLWSPPEPASHWIRCCVYRDFLPPPAAGEASRAGGNMATCGV